jgi:hypothetical protein
LPAGQSAAHDLACIIDNAHAATAVIVRVVENLEIILIGRTSVLAGLDCSGFVRDCLGIVCTKASKSPQQNERAVWL